MAATDSVSDDRLAAAHKALRAGGDVQFDMLPADPPKPPPAWLKAFGEWLEKVLEPVGHFLRWIGSFMPDAPYARIFLWTVIGALALLIVWMIVDRVRHGVWRLPNWRRRTLAEAADYQEDQWAPDAAPARAWLEEADALAGRGRYAEAVHHLLLRSVEDMARRRPQIVRPALTSRDLADAPGIPAAPRRLFGEIAGAVERSLFGGRAINAEEWGRCRAAYADFAQTRTWAA
ncbi:DUF4129 domain-containing protein [Sphingobium sp. AP49]|uniref:DUF4129 domain-containing protein n=1 Tax=Sphingobium sp. AP49 TaxID=1144307 RepID=UPI00026EE17D|nr:DUF4129 domain-containing protein [Sphingobium sp. AP49]WHO38473.1 DUF4129 domain-containing protein [Sphingobium sp. AP49]